MAGFFTKKEEESQAQSGGKILSCISCGRYKDCITPKMKVQGAFRKKILIIGNAPTQQEDKYGIPFQGKSGKLLSNTLSSYGIDLTEDCLLTYACKCRTSDSEGDDRDPTNYEIQCCRKFVFRLIEEYKPKLIILLGDEALYSVIGHRWKKDFDNIQKWRGWCIPDQELRTWIAPVYDPLYVVNLSERRPEILTIWESDIQLAVSKLKEEFPICEDPLIEFLEPDDLEVLSTIRDEFAFDYETTGLKPYAEGHRIVCASVAYEIDKAYVFLIPERKRDLRPFTDLLQDTSVGKIAQNLKYEDTWTKVRLGVEVQNWTWDTMIATHVLDNREGITSLKFQVYVQFGVIDYDSEISPYFKAIDEDNKNSINRIGELLKKPGGKDALLKYCALDSIYELKLAYKQRVKIELPF